MTAAYRTELGRLRTGTTPSPAILAAVLISIIIIAFVAPQAQAQATGFGAAPAAAVSPPAPAAPHVGVDLLVGRSTVIDTGVAIARVSLTVPDVADAMVTAPNQLLIHGKQPGTISLFVWDRAGAIKTYEVNVRRDLTALMAHLAQLFPGEAVEVRGSGKDVIVSGTVSSKYVVEKAAEVAGGYVEKKENVVNLLKQQEGVASNQVMLRVRFAEVSRSALQELGASFVANGFKDDWFARSTTQQFSAPDFDSDKAGGLVFSDFLNLFVFNAKEQLGAVVRALQNKGLFQSLAEPNLIATNGKEASFLAGGEFPYPVVQGGGVGGGAAVSLMFKEFGIRLYFTPTVLGNDLIHLKVKPEVSALDFANGVVVSGFRVPALTTRRTETEVELQNGQTFAIAGLMNNTLTQSMSKIPGLGDIPILGKLFQSRAHQKNQTELVVMITPTIVRRGSTGVSEGLPSLVEPYMGAPDKTYPNPAPYVGSPRYPANRPAPVEIPSAAPQGRPAAPAAGAPPLPSRPIRGAVPGTAVATPSAPQPAAAPATAPLTKQQLKAIEKARKQEQKAAEAAARERAALEKREAEARQAEAKAEAKRRAEQARRDAEAARRADAQRREAEKAREKREAEALKKKEEAERHEASARARRTSDLQEAMERLQKAQAEYDALIGLEKPGAGTGEAAKAPVVVPASSKRIR
jgi:pilus assembly protein CpaC